MIFDPYTELRKMPLRMYVTPSDFDQLKQFLAFDKKVSESQDWPLFLNAPVLSLQP